MCVLRELQDGVVGLLSIMFEKPWQSSTDLTDCKGETEHSFFKRGKKGKFSPEPSKVMEGILLQTMHMENKEVI